MQTSIPLYDALVSANVPNDKAKAVVEAFAKEYEDMTSNPATKEDLRLLESRMTIKLGAMLFTAVGLVAALFKALH